MTPLRRSTGLLAALIAAALVLAGCTGGGDGSDGTPSTGPGTPTAPSTPGTPGPTEEPTALFLPKEDMSVDLADARGIPVTHVDLGDAGILNAVGRPVPSPLQASIAVPAGADRAPVVVLLHGVMPVTSMEDPVYQGFDGLVAQLAAEGYVAVSININVNYSIVFGESVQDEWAYTLFTDHLDRLAAADAGDRTAYGIDLTGRVDLTEIHLIGHSRGGEVGDSIVRRDTAAGFDLVRSLIRVGSTVALHHGEGEVTQVDLPVGVIIPEFDGDVAQEGQLVFDEVLADILAGSQRQNWANVVYLHGANHNFFNRAFVDDDRLGERSFADPNDRSTWLTREQQEDFLARYATGFLAVVRDATPPFGTFDRTSPQPVTMFGYPVTASLAVPGARSVLTEPDPATLPAGADFAIQTIPVDSTGLFNHPTVLARVDRRLPLYAITWPDAGSVTFPVTAGDWQADATLSLYVAVDVTAGYDDPAGQPTWTDQSVVVTLTDAAGNRRGVRAPVGTSALRANPGVATVIEGFSGPFTVWEGWTPLGELRLPLSLFDGLDLGSISSITLTGDTPGTLMIALGVVTPFSVVTAEVD